MIEPDHPRLSIVAQCRLVSINRSGLYRKPAPEAAANLDLMRLIDEQFMATPWYGSRPMVRYLDTFCNGHAPGSRHPALRTGEFSNGSFGENTIGSGAWTR